MTVGNRIKKQRELNQLTQTELAEKIMVSKQTLYKYENNIITNIPSDKIEDIAKIFCVSPAYLMGWDDQTSLQATTSSISIPVLGSVPAGIPIEAIQDIIDYEEIDSTTAANGEYFALKIKGDSMEPRICEGDVVIVRKQDDVESGDIAIVMVNGNDATIKRLLKYQDGIRLMPSNPTYDPIYFTNQEILEKPVQVIGKVIENRQKY